MIVEAQLVVTIEGYGDAFLKDCLKAEDQGYRVDDERSKIDWPFFWRRTWKVRMVKDCVIDVNDIVATPIQELTR